MKSSRNTTNWNNKYGERVYGKKLILPSRPADNLIRPFTVEEKVYCWIYYLKMIQDPRHTREILDSLDNIPSFKATWNDKKPLNKRKTFETG